MAFMIPMASWFEAGELNDEWSHLEEGEEMPAGWYGYLSAPGYLDRTDYSGPFDSEDEALAYVMDFYEVDENGDDLEDVDCA